MPYDPTKDPSAAGPSIINAAPARSGFVLTNAMINADLGTYGRALRVRMSAAASIPLTIVGVLTGEKDDGVTVTITVDATEYMPIGFRRINSLNAGSTVPSGVEIFVVT